MPMRSLLSSYSRKSCCNTLFYQIRYGSNFTKNKSNQTPQVAKDFQSSVNKFQKKFPRISAIYTLVVGGFRAAIGDFKRFVQLANKMARTNQGEACLNVEELLFYHEYKLNIRKLVPLLVLGVLPFGNFLIVPLVYFYPRKTVTSHFWSENQKVTFAREEIQERFKHHQPIVNKLIECRSPKIPDNLVMDWRQLLQELQHGKRPSTHEILKYSKLFHRSGPYYLQNLPTSHIVHLNAAFGISPLLSPLKKAVWFANFNLLLDKRIRSMGGPAKLPSDVLYQICFIRGVNAIDMKEQEKIFYLDKWLKLNEKVDIAMFSLLLHTPVLLGYSSLNDKSVSKKS